MGSFSWLRTRHRTGSPKFAKVSKDLGEEEFKKWFATVTVTVTFLPEFELQTDESKCWHTVIDQEVMSR